MRQLLSRKSRRRLSDDQRDQSSTPGANQQRGHAGERVFPIRNLRNNDDVLTHFPNVKNDGSKPDGERNEYTLPTLPSLPNLPTIRSNDGPRSPEPRSIGTRDSDEQRKVTDRSQFVPATSGPPRIILNSAYRKCEDEPIHTPGAVQPFGALIGLKYNEHGKLEVRIASENTRKILGYGPEQLFELASFLDILKDDTRNEMVARIDNVLSDLDALKEETRLDIFQINLTFPFEPNNHLWCAVHLAPNPAGMVICEFEEFSDAFYLKDGEAATILPVIPVHLLGFEESLPEDFEKSTTRTSKPLPALKVARQKVNQEFSSLDLFNAMTQSQKQITQCESVQNVLEVVVGIISELSGFHRVMFYRFDTQKNGCVDAEMLNPKASTDVYRGMHFPASDIPKQARELYIINRIRILQSVLSFFSSSFQSLPGTASCGVLRYLTFLEGIFTSDLNMFKESGADFEFLHSDRDATTARLVARNDSEFKQPLDLTHSYLRAMSPIHNKYLANMGVRSTMSISIVINADLWGLVACHGYGDTGTRVSLPIRELCRNIGECAAGHIKRLLMQQRISAGRLATTNPTTNKPPNVNSSTDLLKLVDADFALLSIDEKPRAIGRLDPYQEALAIIFYLQSCKFTTIRSSHNIKADFPGLSYPPGINTIAGLLFVPLNAGEGNNFLVFFRKAQEKHVTWAGNPHHKNYKMNSEYLEPRASFQRWSETISGTSKEWTEDQLDTASVLAELYGKSIEAWRQKGQAGQNGTEAEDDPVNLGEETFNLNLTTSKVMKRLQKEAGHKGLDLSVAFHDQLPAMVKGEADRFKQVLAYFTGNGFKNSTSVKVDISLIRTKDDISVVGISVEDSGPGMSEAQLDDTFQEFEQAQEEGWPLPAEDGTNGMNGDVSTDLALIARYVRKVNGQILVSSELAKGTVFSVELPFEHVASPDISRPRKLRNLFLPTPGPPKGNSLPGHQPSMKSPRRKSIEIQRKVETPTKTNDSSPPRVNENSVRAGAYDHALSVYGAPGETTPPHISENHSQKDSNYLNILVAEDDPISLRMLDEKLSLLGHTVDIASDGQQCHSQFASNQSKVDVILMDLEMPTVDGILSTKMIRFLEKQSKNRQSDARDSSNSRHRVPIIALSTTLDDGDRFDFIENGFDGWILKPVDFRRLDLILHGVKKPKSRRDSLYVLGEKGGWFLP